MKKPIGIPPEFEEPDDLPLPPVDLPRLDGLVAELARHGVRLVFRRDGTMALSGSVPAELSAWLKQNRSDVWKRHTPYTAIQYLLPSCRVLYKGTGNPVWTEPEWILTRAWKTPKDPPPPSAVSWRWSHETEWEPLESDYVGPRLSR